MPDTNVTDLVYQQQNRTFTLSFELQKVFPKPVCKVIINVSLQSDLKRTGVFCADLTSLRLLLIYLGCWDLMVGFAYPYRASGIILDFW